MMDDLLVLAHAYISLKSSRVRTVDKPGFHVEGDKGEEDDQNGEEKELSQVDAIREVQEARARGHQPMAAELEKERRDDDGEFVRLIISDEGQMNPDDDEDPPWVPSERGSSVDNTEFGDDTDMEGEKVDDDNDKDYDSEDKPATISWYVDRWANKFSDALALGQYDVEDESSSIMFGGYDDNVGNAHSNFDDTLPARPRRQGKRGNKHFFKDDEQVKPGMTQNDKILSNNS